MPLPLLSWGPGLLQEGKRLGHGVWVAVWGPGVPVPTLAGCSWERGSVGGCLSLLLGSLDTEVCVWG